LCAGRQDSLARQEIYENDQHQLLSRTWVRCGSTIPLYAVYWCGTYHNTPIDLIQVFELQLRVESRAFAELTEFYIIATMSAQAGRLILNEILNSDYRDLQERIDKHPEATGTLGVCGESPAHIAIYKRDPKMLMMLLKAGVNPNLVNFEGNTLVHVAAMLGYFECLQMLYETTKCLLILKNTEGQTALDVARSPADKAVLHVLKYFAEYRRGEPSEQEQLRSISHGRKLCADYLAEKMVYDREQKVRNMVQETLEANNSRRNKARILRGVGGTNYTSFYADLSHHTDINKPHWEPVDMEFFLQYDEGIDHIVRTIFACDYANKSVRAGMHNVLTRMKVRLPVNTYPVPTAEARIPGAVVEPTALATAVKSGLTVLEQAAPRGGPATVTAPSLAQPAQSSVAVTETSSSRKELRIIRSPVVPGSAARNSTLLPGRSSSSRTTILPVREVSKQSASVKLPAVARASTSPQRQGTTPPTILAAGGDSRRNLLVARGTSHRTLEQP
jgi:hypothetical protein